MSKLLHKHETNFTVIPNEILQSKELSMRDIGLLCYLLSLPDDWDFSVKGIAHETGEGQASITKSARNLEAAGFLKREAQRNELGQIQKHTWTVSNEPVFRKSNSNPYLENPDLENPDQENRRQINKIYKKENNKKEKINKERNTRYAVLEEHSDLELVQVEGGYYAWRRKQ